MIVIINYGMGNLRSVEKAVELCGGSPVVSNKVEDLKKADKIVLPGVGAFGEGMKNLGELSLLETLREEVLIKKKPFLGICLGMQLVAKKSYEFGEHEGLGWLDAEVKKFPSNMGLKVPHVGWDDILIKKETPLFNKTSLRDPSFYFVHSYYMENNNPEDVVATCIYGIEFTAAINKENIFATQFHPEKSQNNGLSLLKEFIAWQPKMIC